MALPGTAWVARVTACSSGILAWLVMVCHSATDLAAAGRAAVAQVSARAMERAAVRANGAGFMGVAPSGNGVGQDNGRGHCLHRPGERLSERAPFAPSGVLWLDPAQALRSEAQHRSEEHTSELQSHLNLVCRLLLENKKTH